MKTSDKLTLIKEVGEEIITEEDLIKLLESKKQLIAYDGFEPSGQIHIAQGLLRAININKLTSAGIKFKILVADYFAMLNNKLGGDLEKIQTTGKYAIEVWKSCGMDLKNVEFVWASEFYQKNPDYWKTVMKLAINSTVTRVLRCSQIMGREEGDKSKASQIMYPLMQAADIIHLNADIAQLGLDQRKVNMLARDIFPKIGKEKPIAIHHHMLLGLQFSQSNLEGIDRKIAMKMSKSKLDTAIFMTDSEQEVQRKFKKAHCIDTIIEDNPVLEYAKYIVFELMEELKIERPEQYGGNLSFKSYEELENTFLSGTLKSIDLKTGVAFAINKLLEPTRTHFSKGNPKRLLEQVQSFQVTR
ncbi:tyrosine--tRNA ligase [Candidatus Woesearchaeota archaeon CG10_big_fil_rev_8_21_14_0_10_32_24]|nr:MAG: tyrosine--tRNA ligase [Candidatus Woesearchaeota archaeon CG10_big_fil_rev_8_21_14_0_10_32_24]